MKTIVVTVSPQGQTRIETKGFAGAVCQQASAPLERALGQREQEQLTAEYHAAQQAEANRHQQR